MVSRETPIRLWGRSCASRRVPVRKPVLEWARELGLPCPLTCSSAQVKVLRSPQLRRWRRPGRLRRGSVTDVQSGCVSLTHDARACPLSDTLITCRINSHTQDLLNRNNFYTVFHTSLLYYKTLSFLHKGITLSYKKKKRHGPPLYRFML